MSHTEPEHSRRGCVECGEQNGHAVGCSHGPRRMEKSTKVRKPQFERKCYLGDSVYVEFDERRRVKLTTENGLPTDPSNVIFLEPEVIASFLDWLKVLQFEIMTRDV